MLFTPFLILNSFIPIQTVYTNTAGVAIPMAPTGASSVIIEVYGPGQNASATTNPGRNTGYTAVGGYGGNYAKKTLYGSAALGGFQLAVGAAATSYSSVSNYNNSVVYARAYSSQTTDSANNLGDVYYTGGLPASNSNAAGYLIFGGGVAGPSGNASGVTGLCTVPGNSGYGSGKNYGGGGYVGTDATVYAPGQGCVVLTWM